MENEKPKKAGKRFFISVMCVIIVTAVTVVSLCNIFMNIQMKSYYSNTLLTASSIIYNSELKELEDNSSDIFLKRQQSLYTNIAAKYLENNDYNEEAFLDLSLNIYQGVAFYYYTDEGEIIKYADLMDLEISNHEMTQLCESGRLEKTTEWGGAYIYTSCRVSQGYVIAFWEPEYNVVDSMADLFLNDWIYTADNQLLIVDNDSNEIFLAFDETLQGKTFDKTKWKLKSSTEGNSVIESGRAKIDDELCMVIITELNEKYDLVLYMPYYDYMIKNGRDLVIPPLMFVVVVIVLSIFVVKIRKRKLNEDISNGKMDIRKHNLSKGVLSYFNVLALLGMIIILGATTYFQMLTVFSEQNQKTKDMLDSLSENIEYNLEAEDKVTEEYYGSYAKFADFTAWFIEKSDMLNHDDLLKITSSAPEIEEISVFDGSGDCVASSKTKQLYPLSKDKTDADYPCRALLETSNKEYVGTIVDEKNNLAYIAVRRQDAPGVVRLTVYVDDLIDIQKLFSIDNAVYSNSEVTEVENGVFAYVDLKDSEVLYWYENDMIDTVDNNLDSETLRDEYSGQKRINGEWYYVNTEKSRNYTLLSLLPTRMIFGHYMPMLIVEAVGLLIIVFLYIIGGFIYRKNDDSEEVIQGAKKKNDDIDVLNDLLKANALLMLGMVMGTLFIVLWLDSRFSEKSLLSYVYGMDWDKGYNLYSITAIVMTTTMTLVISLVLSRLVKIIFSKMGNKMLGIGQLIQSLIKIVAGIVIVFFGLYQIGMDPTAMLASAGITSIIFAYGVKDVVNDIVYGILHMTDGIVSLGDMVNVNGIEGKVVEVGFRHIVIESKSERKTFRNSKVNEIVKIDKKSSDKGDKNNENNNEKNGKSNKNSKAVSVAKDFKFSTDRTDITRLLEVLEEQVPMLKDKIPGCMEAPVCEGITGFECGTVTISVSVLIDKDSNEYEPKEIPDLVGKKLTNEVGRICLNNGITL